MTSINWSRTLLDSLAAELAPRLAQGPAVQVGGDEVLALALRTAGIELAYVETDAAIPSEARTIIMPGTLGDIDSGALAGFARDERTIVVLEKNRTHGSRRLNLLLGRPTETPSLPLGAVSSILVGAGYGNITAGSTLIDPLDGVESDADLPGTVVEWLRGRDDALEAEYLVVARPGPASPVPLTATPLNDYARPNDQHAQRRREAEHEAYVRERREALLAQAEAARYDLLTLRDHAVAAEGAAAAAIRSAKEAEGIADAILNQPRGLRRYASTLLNTATSQSPVETVKWATGKASALAKRVRNA